VRRGLFRIISGEGEREVIAGPGELIGELALMVEMRRPATAIALEPSTVVRVSRTLYQRVLESHPEAARRVRDDLEARTNAATAAIARLAAKLS